MTEQVPYDIVKKIEDIEIRRYPEVIFAVVEDNDDDSGFGLLFEYISGENKTRSRIAMTAPVVTSEKIKMTAPVITRKNYMAFAIPSSYNKETVPAPINPSVKIDVQPKKTMAVLRFSGHTPDTKVQKYIQALVTTLKTHNIQTKSEPVLMRYNSPFSPGFLRRNEVAVEIDNMK
jgi:effector-binding domain-containing protein